MSKWFVAWNKGYMAFAHEVITTIEWDRYRMHVEALRRSGAYED